MYPTTLIFLDIFHWAQPGTVQSRKIHLGLGNCDRYPFLRARNGGLEKRRRNDKIKTHIIYNNE